MFIWTILTFLVLLALLAKFAWRPLLQALESRQESIRKSLDDAQKAKQELERLHVESAEIMRQARVEADAIISAEPRRRRAAARGNASRRPAPKPTRIVKNAERQIQLETGRALQQIRREAVDLSVMIASKLIQRNLTKEDNERLIDEALKQVEGPRH